MRTANESDAGLVDIVGSITQGSAGMHDGAVLEVQADVICCPPGRILILSFFKNPMLKFFQQDNFERTSEEPDIEVLPACML